MENRLAAITPKTVEDESRQIAFKYDYMGRRIRKTVEQYDEIADTWDKLTDQLFIYDQWNVLLVLDAENSDSTQHIIERKYTWGLDLSGQSGNFTASGIHGAGGIAGLLAVEEVSGTYAGDSYWYLYDANGNVGQLVENMTGYPIEAKYEYAPYGKIIGPDLDGDGDWKDDATQYAKQVNPFRFSTKWLDHELAASGQTGAMGRDGLYYYGYRYYSPELGRWIKRDPIEEDGGVNLFSFALNSATVRVDTNGLAPITLPILPDPGPGGSGRVEVSDTVEVWCNLYSSGLTGTTNFYHCAVRCYTGTVLQFVGEGTGTPAAITGYYGMDNGGWPRWQEIDSLPRDDPSLGQFLEYDAPPGTCDCIRRKGNAINGIPRKKYEVPYDYPYNTDGNISNSNALLSTLLGCCGKRYLPIATPFDRRVPGWGHSVERECGCDTISTGNMGTGEIETPKFCKIGCEDLE